MVFNRYLIDLEVLDQWIDQQQTEKNKIVDLCHQQDQNQSVSTIFRSNTDHIRFSLDSIRVRSSSASRPSLDPRGSQRPTYRRNINHLLEPLFSRKPRYEDLVSRFII